MRSHFARPGAENDRDVGASSPLSTLVLVTVVACAACTPLGALQPYDIDRVEQDLESPSGELETTDSLGLAYMIFATRAVLAGVGVAAAELPGLNRSPLFDQDDVVQCRSEVEGGFEIDYECLPDKGGRLRVTTASGFANENGDYRIQLEGLSVVAGLSIDATAEMRVEGVANPTMVERTTVAPLGFVNEMPERFRAVEQTAFVVENERGKEKLSFITVVLEDTYAWAVTDSRRDGELGYTIRDRRNVWDCTSEVDGTSILSSECRTPVGQGDFAVLRF